jgi:phage shock protein E
MISAYDICALSFKIKTMFGLSKLFGPKTDFSLLVKSGAVIIDVRTAGEFAEGHIRGAKNISLDKIQSSVASIKKLNKPVIACCRSGARSSMAVRFLKGAGIDAYNGGPWTALQNQLQ